MINERKHLDYVCHRVSKNDVIILNMNFVFGELFLASVYYWIMNPYVQVLERDSN